MFELTRGSIDMRYLTKFGQNLIVNSLAIASQISFQETRTHNLAQNGATALMLELIRVPKDIYHPTKFGQNPIVSIFSRASRSKRLHRTYVATPQYKPTWEKAQVS